MTLFERLYEDMKQAMKAHEEVKLNVIRMAIAACKYYKTEKYGSADTPLTDEDVLFVLNKQIKQRKDSIESYVSGDRHDLADKEKEELTHLHPYMPAMMSEDEIRAVVVSTKDETGLSDMGKLMGAVMAKVKGKADGSVVQKLVKESLS
jgi:uncharacterized protein